MDIKGSGSLERARISNAKDLLFIAFHIYLIAQVTLILLSTIAHLSHLKLPFSHCFHRQCLLCRIVLQHIWLEYY